MIDASFTYKVENGQSDIQVTFTDTSTGSPTSWLWNFGDGQSSDLQNPVHIYKDRNFYDVTLTAFIETGVSFVPMNPDTAIQKSGSGSTNISAHEVFTAAPFSSSDPFEDNTFSLDRFAAASFEYFTRSITYKPDLTGEIGKIILLKIIFLDFPSLVASGAKTDYGGVLRQVPDLTPKLVADISALAGFVQSISFFDFFDFALLPTPLIGSASGWSSSTVFIQSVSFSDKDSDLQTINVNVDWCGMGWIMLDKSIIEVSPSEKFLEVKTDKPVHLIAKYSLEVPNKNVIWAKKYGMPYRCYPHYDVSINGEVEQSQEGDTISHTFDIRDMEESATLTVLLFGTQCGDTVASSAPLFTIDSVLV